MRRCVASAPGDAGTILVLTLWVLALLTLLALAMLTRARLGLQREQGAAEERMAREMLTSLAEMSMARLRADENMDVDSFQEAWGNTYHADGVTLLSGFEGAYLQRGKFLLSVKPVDECGKINVNKAPVGLLAAVLQEAGAGAAAEELASAIADWRDPDETGAAEADAYGGKVPAYTPSNKDLARIEEVLFVNGVTPPLFFGEDANHNGQLDPEEDDGALYLPADNADGQLQLGLMDLFTTCEQDALNVNTCPQDVLRAVFRTALTPSEAETLAQAVVDRRRGADRVDGTEDDTPFSESEALEAVLGQGVLERLGIAGTDLGFSSTAFRFWFRVTYTDTHRIREAEAVAVRGDNGVEVAEWHDGL